MESVKAVGNYELRNESMDFKNDWNFMAFSATIGLSRIFLWFYMGVKHGL
jgi:hypothetical protein